MFARVIARTGVVWTIIPGALLGAFSVVHAEDRLKGTASVAALEKADSTAESSLLLAARDDVDSSRGSFRQLHLDLASARLKAAQLEGYTAVLEIQEERDEQLKPADRVHVKVRHQPFSVYMRWSESGQEVIFVDGENDNRLLVKPTSALAALKRVWRLDPESRLAKQCCKYPITSSGIEKLTTRVQEFYAANSELLACVQCRQSTNTLEDVPVRRYEVRFTDKEVSPEFSGGRYSFDIRTGLLIAVENFGWSDTPEGRLLERYIYHGVDSDAELLDADFDPGNPSYEFTAR